MRQGTGAFAAGAGPQRSGRAGSGGFARQGSGPQDRRKAPRRKAPSGQRGCPWFGPQRLMRRGQDRSGPGALYARRRRRDQRKARRRQVGHRVAIGALFDRALRFGRRGKRCGFVRRQGGHDLRRARRRRRAGPRSGADSAEQQRQRDECGNPHPLQLSVCVPRPVHARQFRIVRRAAQWGRCRHAAARQGIGGKAAPMPPVSCRAGAPVMRPRMRARKALPAAREGAAACRTARSGPSTSRPRGRPAASPRPGHARASRGERAGFNVWIDMALPGSTDPGLWRALPLPKPASRNGPGMPAAAMAAGSSMRRNSAGSLPSGASTGGRRARARPP